MRGTPILFQNFLGGVNALDAPYNLKDNEARDARNVNSTVRGAIRKRNGTQVFATAPANLLSLFGSLNPHFLIGATGAVIYSIAPNGTVTSIATGLTASSRWEFVNAPSSGGQGPLYGLNGVEAQQWAGSGSAAAWTAASGTLPLGKYLLYKNNRVWVAGMASYGSVADPGSTLVWSDIAKPRDWPAENIVEFDPNDGDQITGIGTAGSLILVFKAGKAYVVYDLNTGANRPAGEGVGCVSHRSIVETPYGTFFLSRDHGVMRTNGQSFTRASDRVQPLIDSMSTAQRQAATAMFFNDRYYLAFSQGGSVNDLLLEYDIKSDSWWPHSLGEQDLVVWEASSTPALYGAKAGAVTVRQLFVSGATQDDVPAGGGAGTNFTAYWNGPFHTLNRPYQRKRVRSIAFEGKGRIQVSATKDFTRLPVLLSDSTVATEDLDFGTNDGSIFGTNDGGIYGGPVEVAQATIATPGVGRAWSIMFGNNTSDSFEIEAYSLFVDPRKG